MQKKGIILTAVIVLAIAVAAGGAYLLLFADIGEDNNGSTGSEKTSARSEAKESEKRDKSADSDPTEGWQTYENKTAGYTLKYPADWSATRSPASINGAAADYVTFNNDDFDYAFVFGLRKAGSNTILTDWKGIEGGKSVSDGSVSILGQTIEKTYYVEDSGRVAMVFYGPGLGNIFTIGDNEIFAQLSVPGYKDKSLEGSPQEAIADLIVGSLKIE